MKADFLSGLTGRIVTVDNPHYESARQIFNRAIQRYPLVIVYCSEIEDVSNAVRWARKRCVGIRIRSGGHNYEGYCVGNGILVIDMSEMKGIHLDEDNRTVTARGGVTNAELYTYVGQRGYVFPGGTCPTVALSGLSLGGGWGYLCRALGLVCDNLLSLEVVNYEGKVLTANEQCNPDLYWACRGAGGGNFGVVVSMTFALKAKADLVTLFYLNCPQASPETQAQYLDIWQHWIAAADERIGMQGNVSNSEESGMEAFGRGLFLGPPAEAAEQLSPFFGLEGCTISLAYLPFPEAMRRIGEDYPPYQLFKAPGRFALAHYGSNEVNRLVSLIQNRPEGSVFASLGFYALGGAVAETNKRATAFFYRDAPYILNIQSVWADPAYTQDNVAWVNEKYRYLKTVTNGSYVNFPTNALRRYEQAYFGENVPRLRAVKAQYDPYDVFGFPQGIVPAGAEAFEG